MITFVCLKGYSDRLFTVNCWLFMDIEVPHMTLLLDGKGIFKLDLSLSQAIQDFEDCSRNSGFYPIRTKAHHPNDNERTRLVWKSKEISQVVS